MNEKTIDPTMETLTIKMNKYIRMSNRKALINDLKLALAVVHRLHHYNRL